MRIPRGPLTDFLVLANCLIWLALTLLGLNERAAIEGGFIPARMSSDLSGMLGHEFFVPALLTPFSAAFLHANFFHLLVNMLLLLFTGRFVEMALGRQQMAVLYVAGIIGAALGEYLPAPESFSPMVGASGPGSAVIAAYMLLFAQTAPKAWGPIPASIARPLSLLLLWTIINLAMTFMLFDSGVRIAVGAHIGGFIAGLLLVRPLLRWRYPNA